PPTSGAASMRISWPEGPLAAKARPPSWRTMTSVVGEDKANTPLRWFVLSAGRRRASGRGAAFAILRRTAGLLARRRRGHRSVAAPAGHPSAGPGQTYLASAVRM